MRTINNAEDFIARCEAIISEGEYEHYGLRVVEGECPDVGSNLDCSYRWEETECTGEELYGTSSIDVDEKNLREKVEWTSVYFGDHIMLIAGDYREWGEDQYESVIRDAIVLAATTITFA